MISMQYGAVPGLSPSMPQSAVQQPSVQDPSKDDPMRVVVGPFVLAYPKLFEAQPKMGQAGGVLQYSCELYLYQSNPEHQKILATLATAANYAAAAKWAGRTPHMSHQPIRSLAEKDGYAGEPGWFVRVNTKTRPSVVKGNPIVNAEPDDMYPGCLVYASLKADAYEMDMSKGVKWYLNSVWKIAEGVPLAASRTGEQDFAHLTPVVQVNLSPASQFIPQAAAASQFIPQAAAPQYPQAAAAPLQPQAAPQYPQYPPQQIPPGPAGYPQQPQAAPQYPQYPPQQTPPGPAGYPQQPQTAPQYPQYPPQQMPPGPAGYPQGMTGLEYPNM